MSLIPSLGSSAQSSDLHFILDDLLNGMGDYLTNEIGSLNWIECLVNARALAQDKQFITLMANQLSPASSSVYLESVWALIYNTLGLSDEEAIKNYIEFKQQLFNQPPTFSNLLQFFQFVLDSIFIDLQVAPELQKFATVDPTVQIAQDGYAYSSPLSRQLVYCWQPRDNQDNLLMSNEVFNQTVDNWHAIIESWNPAYLEFQSMILSNRGNQNGYGGGYHGLAYNNYLDGYNVVSCTAGSSTITGTNTTFDIDFGRGVSAGWTPPIQIVDDSGTLRTYYVLTVTDPTHLQLTQANHGDISSRTYRCLGIVFDTPGMLDGGGLFHA